MGVSSDGYRVVFDIETAALPEAVEYLEPVNAPANFKDPEKIAAYVAEKYAAQLDGCALDPDLCRVVAIGWQREGQSEPTVGTVQREPEASLLARFWRASEGHLVGFNVIAFDLPVLLRRSLYLGVTPPTLHVDRFRHPRVTDLLQVLSHNGALRFRSLNFYARRFGLDVPDQLSGQDMAQAVKDGRWHDVETHARADVRKTPLLAAKLGWFSGPDSAARGVSGRGVATDGHGPRSESGKAGSILRHVNALT